MFVLKLILTSVVLVLITQSVLTQELERYTIMENSHYQPYEKLFKKRPSVQFNDTYTNQFLLNADRDIDRNKTKQLRVCFRNSIIVDDGLLKNYDNQFKDSRKITEYVLSKISKYTSLKFFLTSKKCHIRIDFRKKLPSNVLGETNFFIVDSQPKANIDIDYKQIKTFVRDYNLKLLKVFMQVLMHEMLHGLGLDHNDDDPDARSIIREAYDFGTQQLLYKKDIYNLRAIYGPRHEHHPTNVENVLNRKYYKDPSQWDDPFVSDNYSDLPRAPSYSDRTQMPTTSGNNRPNLPIIPANRNRSNASASSGNRNRPNSYTSHPTRNRPNSPTTPWSSNRSRPQHGNNNERMGNCRRPHCTTTSKPHLSDIQDELSKIKYSGKKRG